MENLNVIFILIAAIINFIALICFFVLCYNVSSIKKKLKNNGATLSFSFSFYMAMNDINKAREVLIEMIFTDELITESINNDTEALKKQMDKYKDLMHQVGLEFDSKKAVELKTYISKI